MQGVPGSGTIDSMPEYSAGDIIEYIRNNEKCKGILFIQSLDYSHHGALCIHYKSSGWDALCIVLERMSDVKVVGHDSNMEQPMVDPHVYSFKEYVPVAGDVVEFDNYFGKSNCKAIVFNYGDNSRLAVATKHGEWNILHNNSDMVGIKKIDHTGSMTTFTISSSSAISMARIYFAKPKYVPVAGDIINLLIHDEDKPKKVLIYKDLQSRLCYILEGCEDYDYVEWYIDKCIEILYHDSQMEHAMGDPLDYEFNDPRSYPERQAAWVKQFNVKIGLTIKVIKKVEKGTDGWDGQWESGMIHVVGKSYVITEIHPTKGMQLKDCGCWYPYQCFSQLI